jgi:hypothetical protein
MGAGKERSTGVPALVSNVRIPCLGWLGRRRRCLVLAGEGQQRSQLLLRRWPMIIFAELGKKIFLDIFCCDFFGNDIFVRMFLCFFLS